MNRFLPIIYRDLPGTTRGGRRWILQSRMDRYNQISISCWLVTEGIKKGEVSWGWCKEFSRWSRKYSLLPVSATGEVSVVDRMKYRTSIEGSGTILASTQAVGRVSDRLMRRALVKRNYWVLCGKCGNVVSSLSMIECGFEVYLYWEIRETVTWLKGRMSPGTVAIMCVGISCLCFCFCLFSHGE